MKTARGASTSPTSVADAAPVFGEAPLTVRFDGSAGMDSDGDVITHDWAFGDLFFVSDEVSPTHTYTEPGDRTESAAAGQYSWITVVICSGVPSPSQSLSRTSRSTLPHVSYTNVSVLIVSGFQTEKDSRTSSRTRPF